MAVLRVLAFVLGLLLVLPGGCVFLIGITGSSGGAVISGVFLLLAAGVLIYVFWPSAGGGPR